MRMALLAIAAAIGAATLAGPAPAKAQSAQDSIGCPAGYQWAPGHYDRLGKYQTGHCESLSDLYQWHSNG
jgi:hypothetical protein